MKERERLKKLIFVILSKENCLTAKDLYEEVRYTQPTIIHTEDIRGFKSFVKIINSFKGIEATGKAGHPLFYKIIT